MGKGSKTRVFRMAWLSGTGRSRLGLGFGRSPPQECVLAGWEVLVVRAEASASVAGHLQERFGLPDLCLGSQQTLLARISFGPFEAR